MSVEMERAADVRADSVSGRVTVSFPAGVRYRRPDSWPGDASAPDGDDTAECTVAACSVSGGVEVTTR